MPDINTHLTASKLEELNVDKRITVTRTGIDGADFLAIDGRTMFWTYMPGRGRKTIKLYATLEGTRIVFKGGLTGEHSIEASQTISTADRVEAHWRGYVESTEQKLGAR